MNKTVRNVLIAVGVAALVGLVFGFLGAATRSPEVASSGQVLAIAAGCLAFFVAHLCGANRRVATADAGARAQALAFTCPADRALVYFVRTGFAGKAVGVDIVIDGKPVAQITSPRFTCLALAPGPHELLAQVGDGSSALSPAPARSVMTLAAGSITLLHIAIQRGMVKSQLAFEPWTLDLAKARLGNIGMVLPEVLATTTR
ncbi:MAG: hypothetical protein ACXWJ1_11030 [Caldimonas sp.]